MDEASQQALCGQSEEEESGLALGELCFSGSAACALIRTSVSLPACIARHRHARRGSQHYSPAKPSRLAHPHSRAASCCCGPGWADRQADFPHAHHPDQPGFMIRPHGSKRALPRLVAHHAPEDA